MLARMCQLENKIFAVGEPSYRARRSRIKRVREGFENSLRGRIELIDSYARVGGNGHLMSLLLNQQELQKPYQNRYNKSSNWRILKRHVPVPKWRLQAEANDEAEGLLSSQPMPSPAEEINMNDL
ncbi:hypothetical protein SLEP1_g40363 [Rubroshorea leprosula]|uniref:Uncharacterized protein n=1 Tax=Rubroshorea leprosula TaxID=152421 RepID=A0AAV5L4J6_9ROSI|nr:hypothetical protein SLEP1_g40363 [Rubroshorea leprosula]